MNIYRVDRNDTIKPEEFDGFVILANSAREAIEIAKKREHGPSLGDGYPTHTWKAVQVDVNAETSPGIVLESYWFV